MAGPNVLEHLDPVAWADEPQSQSDHGSACTAISLLIPVLIRRAYIVCSGQSRRLSERKELLQELLQDLSSVDTKLRNWFDTRPESYFYETRPAFSRACQDLQELKVWPGLVHSYRSLFHASVTNKYRSLRAKIQNARLHCMRLLLRIGPETNIDMNGRATAIHTLQSMVDDFCATVPSYLEVGEEQQGCSYHTPYRTSAALGLMSPLTICSRLLFVPADQRTWMRGRLIVLSKLFGYRMALIDANDEDIPMFGF